MKFYLLYKPIFMSHIRLIGKSCFYAVKFQKIIEIQEIQS